MTESYDLIVIGSGPGGYVAAIRAAQLGLKVACIDKNPKLGGTCLNVGCIPSKALLHSTELFWEVSHAQDAGIEVSRLSFNFAQMMERKNKIVAGFNDGIAGLFKKNKITPIAGVATLTSPQTVSVGGREVSAKFILLATGSEPIPLPFLPFDERRVLSSTGALSLPKIPKRMAVIGAGVIGVELGSVYARLGATVTFIEFLDRICPTLDEGLSKTLYTLLNQQGMHFHLSSKVTGADVTPTATTLKVETAAKSSFNVEADVVLVCIGRRPYTENLGLATVGITPTAKGFIPIDGRFRTACSTIYAIGDIVDGPMLAHKASEEGVAVAEILAGQNPILEYLAIPNVVYTSPEVAAVGLTEQEAKALGLDPKAASFPFKANSRARCTSEEEGFVKIVADGPTDRLLGVHILGAHASELIAEAALAIQKKLTVLDLIHTPHAHPTLSEALKEAALAVHGRAIHK